MKTHEPGCRICLGYFIIFGLAALICLGLGIWELTLSAWGLLTLLFLVPWFGLWARYYLRRYLGRIGCELE